METDVAVPWDRHGWALAASAWHDVLIEQTIVRIVSTAPDVPRQANEEREETKKTISR